MKFFMALVLYLFLKPAFSYVPKHMVTFGRDGLGWSNSAERMRTNSKSQFKNIDNLINNLFLNYAYRFTLRFQVGAFFENSHNKYYFRNNNGSSSTQKTQVNTLGFFLIYNFHDEIRQSYYLGLSAGSTTHAEELSHDFSEAEGKAPVELDDTNQTYEIFFGRRIILKISGFENLSYSPQVRFFYQTHGKDFDDQNVDYGLGASIHPIKFDLLF